jgi:hypothetical protein
MTANVTTFDLPVLLRGEPDSLQFGIEKFRARQLALYLTVIALGAGAFGAAMGCWRAPLQALYTALKLPLAILLTTLGNAVLNALIAPLFGLNLRFHQTVLAGPHERHNCVRRARRIQPAAVLCHLEQSHERLGCDIRCLQRRAGP